MQHPPFSIPLVDANGKVTRPWVETIDAISKAETIGSGGTSDDLAHTSTTGRELPDSHPIQAITGLENALGDISTALYEIAITDAQQSQDISDIKQGLQSVGNITSTNVQSFTEEVDAKFVHLSGDESIAGEKTFTGNLKAYTIKGATGSPLYFVSESGVISFAVPTSGVLDLYKSISFNTNEAFDVGTSDTLRPFYVRSKWFKGDGFNFSGTQGYFGTPSTSAIFNVYGKIVVADSGNGIVEANDFILNGTYVSTTLASKANVAGQLFTGKVSTPVSTASRAGLNIGAFGVVPSSPVDGDIYKSAADTLVARMSTNTRTLPFLEKAQTFSAVQTFSASPVVSSTTASTTAGAWYRIASQAPVDYEGLARQRVGIVYRCATSTGVSSLGNTTVTMTPSWGTNTLPANCLFAGAVVKVCVAVYTVTNASSGYITVNLAGLSGATVFMSNATAPTLGRVMEFTFGILASGASGSFLSGVNVGLATGISVAEGVARAINTTLANAVTITAGWSGSAGNMNVYPLSIEIA